jgi:hypothetical protein
MSKTTRPHSLVPTKPSVTTFLESLGKTPVFTRKLLKNVASQFRSAQEGKSVELIDCYGHTHTIESNESSALSKVPKLIYNSHLKLFDDEPYNILRCLDEKSRNRFVCGHGNNVMEMIKYYRLPVYTHFRVVEADRDYDIDERIEEVNAAIAPSEISVERKVLAENMRNMFTLPTAQIDNIVCIGHGSLCFGTASIIQHCAALFIAYDLTDFYEEFGTRLETPITVFAQDPGYTVNDKEILYLFPVPIQILTDPEGFLTVNENSLVMSCYPSAPVKQIVADLAADTASGKGPISSGITIYRTPNTVELTL